MPYSGGQNAAMSTQSKSRAQSPHHANAPSPALQKQSPHRKCTPLRRRPTASRSRNMPDSHTPARSSPARKPTPKPTKGREATESKPQPTKKPRPVHPKINPGQPARPNHADPSDPPPPDRTGTGIRNRNPDKEPEFEPEQP
ncbi:hypothetical protein CRENBAI_024427, partial [Crenichthys baileyi]